MSGPVFVLDGQDRPLMPMAPAYARKLLRSGKAHKKQHHAFTVIQLSNVVEEPQLKPVMAIIRCHLHTAEILIVVQEPGAMVPLLRVIVDLSTDLPYRLRRRAGHRRRRKRRRRYHAFRRHGLPFKLRRPSMFHSSWGTLYRQRHHRSSESNATDRPSRSITMRWRAEAIHRTLNALTRLLPMSSVVLPQLQDLRPAFEHYSPAERRQALIEAYGGTTAAGKRIAQCAYCGTTRGPIQVDHLLPRSRGGTDVWANLVLACRDCNRRKGERTPAEAGMMLKVRVCDEPPAPRRTRPYIAQTVSLLRQRLRSTGMQVQQTIDNEPDEHTALTSGNQLSNERLTPVFIAKPISRGRKQVFTARNYPLDTPLKPGYVRIRDTIKRRVRVNAGIVIQPPGNKPRVRTVARRQDATGGIFVGTGSLCEGMRAGTPVIGIVAAVQSNGRLALLTPAGTDYQRVQWRRVLISPNNGLRLLSNDRVIFLHLPPEKRSL